MSHDLAEVLSSHRSRLWMWSANRYVDYVNFMLGARWANESHLEGWQEYVSVQVAHDVVVAWPFSLLKNEFDSEDVKVLCEGGGDERLNEQAIEHLVNEFSTWAALSALEQQRYVDEYRAIVASE